MRIVKFFLVFFIVLTLASCYFVYQRLCVLKAEVKRCKERENILLLGSLLSQIEQGFKVEGRFISREELMDPRWAIKKENANRGIFDAYGRCLQFDKKVNSITIRSAGTDGEKLSGDDLVGGFGWNGETVQKYIVTSGMTNVVRWGYSEFLERLETNEELGISETNRAFRLLVMEEQCGRITYELINNWGKDVVLLVPESGLEYVAEFEGDDKLLPLVHGKFQPFRYGMKIVVLRSRLDGSNEDGTSYYGFVSMPSKKRRVKALSLFPQFVFWDEFRNLSNEEDVRNAFERNRLQIKAEVK